MTKLLKAAILAALVAASPALAERPTGYFCVVEEAAGITFDGNTKTWTSAKFEVGARYMVRERAPEDSGFALRVYPQSSWVVSEFGEENPSYGCESEREDATALRCKGWFASFTFYSGTLRFQRHYEGNFVGINGNEAEGDDTPLIEIGTCSLL